MHSDLSWSIRAATTIGDHVVEQAVPDGSAATWWVNEPVHGSSPPRTQRVLANGNLYSGTAGVSLFLSELGAATGEQKFLTAAHMALEHALRGGPGAIDHLAASLHNGTVGILFAAASYLRHVDDGDLRVQAEALLRELAEQNAADGKFDVISGEAGAILGLLAVSDVFDEPLINRICLDLGERLIDAAQVEPRGISWLSGGPRGGNLCGMAHGAAGIGWALLELYAHTGRTIFRLAAEEAFAYESRWFDAERCNWVDLRNAPLHRYQTEGRLGELRAFAERGGALPLFERSFMAAWCHGAPGIVLTRARAYTVLHEDQYRSEALAALPVIRQALQDPLIGHSLCHGFAGVAEAALVLARVFRLPELRKRVLRRTEQITNDVLSGKGPWRSGRLGQIPDVSFMVGEAGIGLFLLGLTRDVPSATFPVGTHPESVRTIPNSRRLRVKIAVDCFPQTAATMGGQGVKAVLPLYDVPAPTAEIVEQKIRRVASSDESVRQALWVDELALEQARDAPFDHSLAFLHRVFPVTDWDKDCLVTAPWVRRHHRGQQQWLLYPTVCGRWVARYLRPELAVLLQVMDTPRTCGEAAQAMSAVAERTTADLDGWVGAQLRAFSEAGIIIPAKLAEGLQQSHRPDAAEFRNPEPRADRKVSALEAGPT